MVIRPLHLLGRKALFGTGALTSLLLTWSDTGSLVAQTPKAVEIVNQAPASAETAPVQRNFLNKNVIQLPIKIDESSRAQIQEIHLFVKDQPGAPWALRDKVAPTQKAFIFQVPRDGEYWFTMVTVDKQGRSFPSDLRSEPPGLAVVIDTQPPQIELTNLGNSPEGMLIQCDVQDANLNNARVRFQFQGGDSVFRSIEMVPGRPNVYCIPAQAVCTGLVRAMAEDLAGNHTVREVHLNQMAMRKGAPADPHYTPPTLPVAKAPTDPPSKAPPQLPLNLNVGPGILPGDTHAVQKPATGVTRPDGFNGPRFEDLETPNAKPPVQKTEHQESLKRQIVNSPKVFLDYQIENAGPSGVGKVEVWMTRDRGKSWQKISEDTQNKSAVEVLLPGEGLFGVTLVASNGRGAGATPPKAGDSPDGWIEVDTTKPTAEITKVQATTENGKAAVHIHWTSHDKNLGDTPVDLSYASTPQGPWLPIAKGLKGEGQHCWIPSGNLGAQAHLRLTVHDLAGNTSVVGTLEPVLFDDPARPRAVIRGFSTGPSSAPLPMTPAPPPPASFPPLPTRAADRNPRMNLWSRSS